MKLMMSVCPLLLAAAFAGAGCSSSSSPTSSDEVPVSAGYGEPTLVASGPSASHAPSAYGNVGAVRSGNSLVEEFNCTNVQEVFVRFGHPGYVRENAVGLFVSYTGLPAGEKLLRVWWDYEGRPGEYENFYVGEGEVQRHDDALFDHASVVEHAYLGVTAPTDYRVRAEMIVLGKTGNCARVRDVTVTPGDQQVGSGASTLLPNGSFETGDFTSWTAQDIGSPFYALRVGGAGLSPGYGFFSSAPTEGSFAALHGFDGGGGNISLSQTLSVQSATETLRFDYRGAWDMVTFVVSTMDRQFLVRIETTGGAVLASHTILTAPAGTQVLDTGASSGSVPLGPHAGQTVVVRFLWVIPEIFSGPGFFQLDNVRITS